MPWDTRGNANTNPPTDFIGTTDNRSLVIKVNNSEAVRVHSEANSSRVEILAQDGLAVTGFQPFITLRDANANNARSFVQGVDGDIVLIPNSFAGSGAAMVLKTNTGNIGIGTSTPSSRVEIVGQDGLAVTGFQPFITLRDANANNARSFVQGVNGDIALIPDSFAGGGAAMVLKNISGNVGIGTAQPAARLHVVGDVHVTGDIRLTNADCAEDFEVCDGEDIAPGTVVVLSEEGFLRRSTQAYDRRVAGVVSGAGDYRPGLILDSREAPGNRRSIALLGKTFCNVDATCAPIEVGDLLTTAELPGHAMKATDPARAFGSIIGKAMRPLTHGQGLIPILIALQ
jgi:hypothetical protein